LFTNALSRLLPKGSSIIAIDKTKSRIQVADGISLTTKTEDFTTLNFGETDGVMMANSFHYVKDQQEFLRNLSVFTSTLLLVEYNMDKRNRWVPYPISFKKLQSIVHAKFLGETKSQYNSNGMYSALISF
jgi:hypothetical protein